MSLVSDVDRLTAPVRRRVANMIGRAVIALVDDGLKAQGLQVTLLEGETREVERFQEYGFTSVPLPDAEAVCVFPFGHRDHGIVIAVEDRRYRLKGLAGGEVALYDDQGQKVHLTRAGITIETSLPVDIAAASVAIDAAEVTMTGTLAVSGEITALSGAIGLGAFRDIYNTHTHIDNSSNPTSTPDPTA